MLTMPTCFRGPRPAFVAALTLACLNPIAGAASPDPYHLAVPYKPGWVVLGSDGNAYRAAADVKGSDPVTSGSGAWRLAHAASDLVIDVPGRFKTIAEAWRFLAGARITETATVTIELAPGELGHDAPLVLNHAEGARIVLRGAGDKPEECRLVFDGGDGIVVDGGHTITVEQMKVIGSGKQDTSGLTVLDGARAACGNLVIEGFPTAVQVGRNACLKATQLSVEGPAVKIGVRAFAGGCAHFDSCKVRRVGNNRVGTGMLATSNGAIQCRDTEVSGWEHGFYARESATMELDECRATANTFGMSSWVGASVTILGGKYTGNRFGVSLESGHAYIQDALIADNTVGLQLVRGSGLGLNGSPVIRENSEADIKVFGSNQIAVGPRVTLKNLNAVQEAEIPPPFNFKK